MKPGLKPLTALLVVLGIADLVMVPIMFWANHHYAGDPPVPAIFLGAVIGAGTLASIAGLTRGRRWGFWLAMVTRILDAVTAVLGVAGGPNIFFGVVGVILLVLSVPAVVLLVRVNSRRAVGVASGI
jgi:hypothetical protein